MPLIQDIETLKSSSVPVSKPPTGELSNEAISRRSNLIVLGAVGGTLFLLANKKTRKIGYLALAGLGIAFVNILKSY